MKTSYWQDKGSDYRRYRPSYPEALARALAEKASGNELALDVGCGTGQLSVLLAMYFDQVFGFDVSADQLVNAARKENITYKTGAAEAVGAPDHCADLIVAAQAAHWFDLPAFYQEARRLAREGALIALVTYGVLEVDGAVGERVSRLYWNEIHPFWPEGRENVENGYRHFDFPFEPVAMPVLAIEREWSVDHFIHYCGTWSAAKRAAAAGRSDILETARRDLADILGAEGTMKIRWPISARAGRL